MRVFPVVLLASACWTSQPQPPVATLTNHTIEPVVKPHACPKDLVTGILFEGNTEDPAIGATVVLSNNGDDDGDNEEYEVTITDETGTFSLRRKRGTNRITVYFSDSMFEAPIPAEPCDLLAKISIGSSSSGEKRPLVFEKRAKKPAK